jgi:hypothetical protein
LAVVAALVTSQVRQVVASAFLVAVVVAVLEVLLA